MLPSHTCETWKPVPGYEGHYEVSAAQVQSIKSRYLKGERMAVLASEFGVSLSSVKNYISGARKSFI